MTPSNKINNIILILSELMALLPQSQNETVIDSHNSINICVGENAATINAPATIPVPRDNSTRLVSNTITIANIGGIIETQVPIILNSSN